uniref:Uncharacterized protein n=1 Tax=Megaselia scalaris TaxID=36166 RepID=T1H2G4_MEGSC
MFLKIIIVFAFFLWIGGNCENIEILDICDIIQDSSIGVSCNIQDITEDKTLITTYREGNYYARFLRIENSSNPNIPNNIFGSFQQLVTANFDFCNLNTLKSENFENANNLLELSIQGNNLRQLTSEVFSNVKALVKLELQKNQIEDLQQGCFNGIRFLKDLNLSGNRIRTLNANIFNDMKNLQVLDLSNNKLEGINRNLFKENSKIQVLDLSFNNIAYIHGSTFTHMNLNILDVSNNHFRKLVVHNCKNLYTSNSGIVEIVFKSREAMNELIANDNEIEQLSLSTKKYNI